MNKTYRAMQVSAPGVLELVERETPTPGPGEVLLEVQACGVCGADAGDIEKADPAAQRVPGHEVVGRIVATGQGTPAMWSVGQRVGVGRLGGHCHTCSMCRRGLFQLCQNHQFVGSTCDGGYAEMMVARCSALVAIPPELDAVEAAPLLCAGIATFNALKKSSAQAGDVVVVLGIGGLGHLAIQYARKMGFKVVAVGRGADIASDVIALGAHSYIDLAHEDVLARLAELGGAQAIVSSISDPATVSQCMKALLPQGRLVLLGAGKDPIPVSPGHLVVGERSVLGSITGTPYEMERTLDFSVLADVRAWIEPLPFEAAQEAYERLKSGKATYRMVLTMGSAQA